MERKIGYKVLYWRDGQLVSFYSDVVYVYEVGKVTKRNEGRAWDMTKLFKLEDGPLAIFDSLASVHQFLTGCYNKSIKIYKCYYKESKDVTMYMTRASGAVVKVRHDWIPPGTILCDEVELFKEVSSEETENWL